MRKQAPLAERLSDWQKADRPEEVRAALESPERLAALHGTKLLDSPREAAFDRLTGLAKRLLDVPVILLSLVGTERQFFKSAQGLAEPWASLRGTPLSHSFCQHVVGSGDVLVINDARADPLVHDNAAIHDLGVIAYLGVPLVAPGGQMLGSFCAIDQQPRLWSQQDVVDLTDFAAVAAVEIASRQHLGERQRIEEEMRTLVGELDHRIRNLLTVIQAIARQTGSEEMSAKQFLEAFCHRLGCLAAAHAALVESQYRGAQLAQIAHASLGAYAERIDLQVPDRRLEPNLAMAMALALHELATNAIKYGALRAPAGRVTFGAEEPTAPHMLTWRELGGPPVAPPEREGFGLRMLHGTLSHHGGAADLDWRPEGLICRLRLP